MIMRGMAAWLAAGAIVVVLAGCSLDTSGTPASADAKPAMPSDGEATELVVSAAASLTDSLQLLQKSYETGHSGIKIHFNFGASGMLQQQIEQGAPADLFVSAAAKHVEALVAQGLVDSTQQTTLLHNELVLVVPRSEGVPIKLLDDLVTPEVKRIAIGEPESVPAGGYAKEALKAGKLWDLVQTKLVFGKDVRQVLTYVESGNADAGLVYKTDALTSKQVIVAQTVDAKLYTPIQVPIAIVKASKHAKEAQQFYEYMQTREAAAVFTRFGFTPAQR